MLIDFRVKMILIFCKLLYTNILGSTLRIYAKLQLLYFWKVLFPETANILGHNNLSYGEFFLQFFFGVTRDQMQHIGEAKWYGNLGIPDL